MNCQVCGRVLTDAASIQAGIGPVCRAAQLGQPELFADSATKADLPLDIETMDIVCKRDERGAHFNIDQIEVLHSPTGMEWGYGGSGPADFALNILARFTDHETAHRLHQMFKERFVQPLPLEGGTIRGEEIASWVEHWAAVTSPAEEYIHV